MHLLETMKGSIVPRNWSATEADQAYMSHHHTLEAVAKLAFEHGLFESAALHSIGEHEYRNTFVSLETKREFSVSTIVYPDSSTYTFIHQPVDGSALSAVGVKSYRLSNANIRRAEGRAKREAEIKQALEALEILPQPPVEEKKTNSTGGIVSRVDADGTRILDYSGVRSGKIEAAERVIDYRKFNKVPSNGPEPSEDN